MWVSACQFSLSNVNESNTTNGGTPLITAASVQSWHVLQCTRIEYVCWHNSNRSVFTSVVRIYQSAKRKYKLAVRWQTLKFSGYIVLTLQSKGLVIVVFHWRHFQWCDKISYIKYIHLHNPCIKWLKSYSLQFRMCILMRLYFFMYFILKSPEQL